MVWWQVLELAEQAGDPTIPQLLIKSVSSLDSYVVHLTDLSNIWSEQLDLNGIVERASQVQSPIEISKQDTSQLSILLDNVMKSLKTSGETSCHITRNDQDGITLNATIRLPEPLESLTWEFCLEKTTAMALKNEFILPLLVSSHIQQERITSLVSMIADRDKAIRRLIDQHESNNLDLAAAFPVLGGLKSGRKMIKREQAAKHITALQPFHEASWRENTGKLEDSRVTTLGLFQEALAQSDSKVPFALKSENESTAWWNTLLDRLISSRAATKSNMKEPSIAKPQEKAAESSEDETEDEFETHDNFKTRYISKNTVNPAAPSSLPGPGEGDNIEDADTEDSEDLDVAPKISREHSRILSTKSVEPDSSHSTSPKTRASTMPVSRVKNRGFQIGGNTKKALPDTSPPLQIDGDGSVNIRNPADAGLDSPSAEGGAPGKVNLPKSRRPFKIGGKNKNTQSTNESGLEVSVPQQKDDTKSAQPSADGAPVAPPSRQRIKDETTTVELIEETAEEKAERKRAELKRKNDDAAKKQAQQKKKKRF